MQDAESPFGIPWMYLGLMVAGLLLVTMAVAVVRHRRDIVSLRGALFLAACLGAVAWTVASVGRDVRVPIPEDPEGAVCLLDPFGWEPDHTVDWGSECGQAYASHLAWSIGPSAVMLVLALGAVVFGVRRSPRAEAPTDTVLP